MAVFELIAFLIASLLIGFLIRLTVKRKPKAQLIIWASIMIFMFAGLVLSLVLVFGQEPHLFTKSHMANEVFIIVTAGFLTTGGYYFIKNRHSLLGQSRLNK